MPICINQTNAGSCPVIVCDICGEIIEDAADGHYWWPIGPGSGLEPVVFTHTAHGEPVAADGRPFTCSSPLTVLPIYLANNLKWDRHEGEALARMMNLSYRDGDLQRLEAARARRARRRAKGTVASH
jgi:hypothetical protein